MTVELSFDMHDNPVFTYDSIPYTLKEWAKFLMDYHNESAGRLENDAGINHPRFYIVSTGKSRALQPVLSVMYAKGWKLGATHDDEA